nr:MAG TPA: hypothetical protein [Caudoviricetes sp.]
MRAGPRSNFSMLPFPLRLKIIFMIDDGATFDAVANDPEIAGEYKKRGLRLTPPAMSGIKKSQEYREMTAKRRQKQLADQSEQITTALLRDAGELDTISDQVKVALLRLVQDCVRANPDDTKEVERLVRSAVNLSNPAKDNQIAEWKRKWRDEHELRLAAEKEHAAREAELLAENAAKDARIAELEKLIPGVDSGKVADAMDEKFGV